MSQFEVDPDSLVAAGEVGRRQGEHVGAVADYIGGTLNQVGAFSGVLNLFQGSYEATIASALDGMADSRAVAERVKTGFDGCSQDYLASDRSCYDLFRRAAGDLVGLDPYQAPGSGATEPGLPGSGASGPGAGGEDPSPFKLPGLDPLLDKPLGSIAPGPEGDLPPWADPRKTAKDWAVEHALSPIVRERYLELRAAGLSPQDAYTQATDRLQVSADTHVYDVMGQRGQQAYDDAYDRAVDGGASPEEARRAANDAADRQYDADSAEHSRRTDVLDAAGTYRGLYDEVTRGVSQVQEIGEEIDDIAETTDDIGGYEDYSEREDDRSAQEWAGR